MRYMIDKKIQMEGWEYWSPMVNKEGIAKLFKSTKEARNYLHDAGYTIDDPNVRIVELPEEFPVLFYC